MFRTVNDQPTLWDAILPRELLVLSAELDRVDDRRTARWTHAEESINDDDVRDVPEELTELHTWRLGPFRDFRGELRHT